MTITTRQHVTDVFAVPVKNAALVRVDAPPVQQEAPVRECFTRRTTIPQAEQLCCDETDDAVRAHLQDLVNEHSHHLCVCSPNREDMLRARAEMHAHPGWAEYKARRDAAMGRHIP